MMNGKLFVWCKGDIGDKWRVINVVDYDYNPLID